MRSGVQTWDLLGCTQNASRKHCSRHTHTHTNTKTFHQTLSNILTPYQTHFYIYTRYVCTCRGNHSSLIHFFFRGRGGVSDVFTTTFLTRNLIKPFMSHITMKWRISLNVDSLPPLVPPRWWRRDTWTPTRLYLSKLNPLLPPPPGGAAHTDIFHTTTTFLFFPLFLCCAIILNPTSTGCLLRVQTSALGAPEIASQATHSQNSLVISD